MGDFDSNKGANKVVFVTVGTICYDALVRVINTTRIKEELYRKGYTDLVIQMGRGSYIPSKGEVGPLVVDYVTFSSSINEYLRSVSCVNSHAGVLPPASRSPFAGIPSSAMPKDSHSFLGPTSDFRKVFLHFESRKQN